MKTMEDIVTRLEADAARKRIEADALDELASKLTVELQASEEVKKRSTARAKPQTRRTRKRGNGIGVASERVEKVFRVVQGLTEPMPTSEIARMSGIPQSSVGKILAYLNKEGRIRRAGLMPNVKGKRPMYAPLPTGETIDEALGSRAAGQVDRAAS